MNKKLMVCNENPPVLYEKYPGRNEMERGWNENLPVVYKNLFGFDESIAGPGSR